MTDIPAAEPQAPKAPKKKHTPALIVRPTISIPLNTADPKSYEAAITALAKLGADLPVGTHVDLGQPNIGKMESPA